jgi:acetylornithine deacetylase/succinyl-diaminopimelate desuccinylase-like protein
VPVERSKWTLDPFAGVAKDGYIYGRGAMDFKGGLAVFARAVMMLAENKVPLSRDVIFLSEADEEQGAFGTEWLAKNHWDKIDAEFALNEGGWILQNESGETQQVNITTIDKISATFTLTTQGVSTHSSRPLPPQETAIGRLVAALARLAVYDPEAKVTPLTAEYFNALAKTSTGPLARDLRTLTSTKDRSVRNAAAKRIVTRSDYPLLLHALMRDTMVITLLNAGVKANVIPGSAQATVNTRLLPGTTTDEIIAEIKRVLRDPGVEVKIAGALPQDEIRALFLKRTNAPPSPTDTVLYQALLKNAKRLWPKAEVVPAVFEAGTDAFAWRDRMVPVYGIYPYPLNNEILLRMHGNDERIGAEQLRQGTEWVYNTLLEVAVKR